MRSGEQLADRAHRSHSGLLVATQQRAGELCLRLLEFRRLSAAAAADARAAARRFEEPPPSAFVSDDDGPRERHSRLRQGPVVQLLESGHVQHAQHTAHVPHHPPIGVERLLKWEVSRLLSLARRGSLLAASVGRCGGVRAARRAARRAGC